MPKTYVHVISKKVTERADSHPMHAHRPSIVPYVHIVGLAEHVDPAWAKLEEPDVNGFRGLTCAGIVFAQCDDGFIAPVPRCVQRRDVSGAGPLAKGGVGAAAALGQFTRAPGLLEACRPTNVPTCFRPL